VTWLDHDEKRLSIIRFDVIGCERIFPDFPDYCTCVPLFQISKTIFTAIFLLAALKRKKYKEAANSKIQAPRVTISSQSPQMCPATSASYMRITSRDSQ